MTNTTQRANLAAATLKSHNPSPASDRQQKRERLIDLLTDLRHWSEREGIDFLDANRMAGQHYNEEREQ